MLIKLPFIFVMLVYSLAVVFNQQKAEEKFWIETGIAMYRAIAHLGHTNDTTIISSFPFKVPIRRSRDISSVTYAVATADGKISELNIVNQDHVPYGVFCLESLRELSIRNTSFYELDPGNGSVRRVRPLIHYLAPTLKRLLIQDSNITHLPDEIGQLKQLISLEVLYTDLVSIPNTIGDLPLLDNLDVTGNQLLLLPATLQKNGKLRKITVSSNPKLRSLESLNGHPSLQILIADDCIVEKLPLRLPVLHLLWMSNNKLTNLDGIETLGAKANEAKQFSFDRNQIKSIPSEVKLLKNVLSFNINHNPLEQIPLDILTTEPCSGMLDGG